MRLLHAAAIGLLAFGAIKAAIVLILGPKVGIPAAALVPIALLWAAGPLAAGWVAHRVRARRRAQAARPRRVGVSDTLEA